MKKKFLKKDKNFSKSIKNNSTNYLNIFENMVLGVSIFELILNKEEKIVDLQITYVNRRSILNKFKKHEKFTGKGINELFKKDIADFYLNIARKAVSTGKSLRFETYFEQLNKYFLINAFLSGNNSFVILDLDITQKKETEEELRNTLEHLEIEKRQLSAIVENIPVGVIIAEAPSGKFILANKQIAEIWRYPQAASADEFKKYKGFHHDGSPYKPYEWPLSRSIRTGKAVKDEEIQILRGDGTKGWLSVSSVPVNDNGNIIMGIVIDLDITERKKAEENLKKARNNLEGQVKERTAELKKAYGLLKESEEKFRELFNKATDTIVLSEVKENGMPGKFIEINEAASKRLGYNKDEFENMTPLDLFASDNRDELSQITSELQKKGYTSFESISITKYKEEFPVEVNVHVFKLRGRNVALAIARDISERKKVEKALRESVASKSKILDDLRESEGKFRALYDDNPSMYFTVGPDFIVLSVNQFGAELLGYKVPELINQPLSIVFYDKDKEFAVQNLKHTLENHGQVFYWELRKKRKDGSILWVKETARAVKEPEGNVVIYTVCEDITDRKEAEKSLKESEKKFRELFDQATDMLSLTELNDDGTINKYIEINEAGSKRLGYSKAEILDMSPLDIYLDHSSILNMVSELLENGYSIAENIQIAKDGRQIPVELNTRLFKFKGKKVVISISRDMTERKISEEKLKRSETILEEASHLSKMGAYEWDMERDEFILSKEWQRIHGVKVNRLSSIELMKIAPLEDVPKVQKALDEALKDIKPYDVEHRIVNQSSGELRYIHARGRILRDRNGKATKMYGVAEDITERKQAEEQIKRLVDIINSSDDAIIGENLNGIIFSWNKGAEGIYGYSGHEMIGKHMSTLMGSSEWKRLSKIREEIKKGKKVAHYEAQRVKKDGTKIDISVTLSPIRDVKGQITGISVISRDITEQKKSEKALIESEEKLNATIESSPDSITVSDLDLKITSCNQATVAMYRASSKDEIIGLRVSDLVVSKHHKLIVDAMNKLLKDMKSVTLEVELYRKDNSIFPVEISANVVRDAKGKPISFVGITKDISYRKNAEKERENLIKELERSNEELQQFAYVASHDLQEPLRTIASFTQLIERRYKGQLDKDADEFMEFIVDGASRMQAMIKDLLQYSRVETRGGEFKPTNVQNALDSALSNLKLTIEENSAKITHDKLPTVIGDEKQFIQLFQNLISNAIKFRKKDVVPKIHISAPLDEEKNEYVFSVSDNGIGMEPEQTKHIFEIFQRLHTKDEYKGTGIGLAVAKKIVERHGGRIWVESKPGKGTTFYFTINLSKP